MSSSSSSFYWVDAFTQKAFSGNPCAVLHVETMPSSGQMLKIAREMGLSETAFVRKAQPAEGADFEARYFTPEQEIPLAGHPTISTVHTLLESGAISPGTKSIRLRLPAGIILVHIGDAPVSDSQVGGTVTGSTVPKSTLITMDQNPPSFHRTYSAADIAPVFGLDESDFLPGAPIQTVSTGTRGLIVPVTGHEALRKLKLNPEAYSSLRAVGDFFSAHLFALEGATPEGRTFARHPGVPPEPAEDPFTGSATGAMAAYLWHYGLIDSPKFIAEQGHWMGRPGSAQVEVVGPRDAITTVKVGGNAVTLIRGTFSLS